MSTVLMSRRLDSLVGEAPTLTALDHLGHALGVGHLPRAVAVVELGQVARQVARLTWWCVPSRLGFNCAKNRSHAFVWRPVL